MKANEAPEKIYIDHHPFRDEWEEYWYSAPAGDKSVEYIRTDAFIEKACEYFRTKKKCVFACMGEDVYHSLLNEEEIEDFKNYMKGEKNYPPRGKFYVYPQYDEGNNLIGFTTDYEGEGASGKYCKIIVSGETL